MIDPPTIHRVVDTITALPGVKRHLEGIKSINIDDQRLLIEIEFIELKATLSDNDQISTYAVTADLKGNVSSFSVTHRDTRSARFARTE